MKTGREVLYRALQLLGYTNGYGEVDGTQDAELMKRGAAAVDQIAADLLRIERPEGCVETGVMDTPLPFSSEAVNDAMPYGVAMLLAQGESDGDSQALYAALYSAKRAGVPHRSETVRDTFGREGFGCAIRR